jgi:hypothetical protein
MLAATIMRALGSIANVRNWMPCPSMFLDQRRLGGALVDRKHRDVAFSAHKNPLPFEVNRGGCPVGLIE